MNCIHEKIWNKIFECSLLYDILNPNKHIKVLNRHYAPILRVCINTQKVWSNFKSFRILLDSEFHSTIIMRIVITKSNPKEGTLMQWHTQSDNITVNLKVKIDCTLPELIAKTMWLEIVMNMTPLRADMTWPSVEIYWDILIALVLNI